MTAVVNRAVMREALGTGPKAWDPDPKEAPAPKLHPRDILVEEVSWLMDSGDRPLGIAARLKKSPATISRALYRAGRNDLAQPFASLDRKARRAQEATQ